MSRTDWIWMPHVAHFIGGHKCLFRLATYVPTGYIVSTVGEYYPDGWDKGRMSLGIDGKAYETMVFTAQPSEHKCCLFELADASELECCRYADAESAREGHVALCEKYDQGEV